MKKPMKELVKREDWKKVRESLVGKWKSEPEKCCKKLSDWLGPITKTEDDKLRIMMNYLTGSGFRMGKIKHKCISTLRASVSVEMRLRKIKNK